MKKYLFLLLTAAILSPLVPVSIAADHGHLNVGAAGTSQNDPLEFNNGGIFDVASGYVLTLLYTNGGTYSNYYNGNITLTGLAATSGHSGPVPGCAAPGSWLFAQIAAVEGPPGGAFAFWDTGATSPTISLGSGTTGTNLFRFSENDGSPGSDPYGHIHGRRFTATKPGLYAVSFRVFDRSTNGIGGGPIHTPSNILKIYVQAGVTIASLQKSEDTTTITFGARLNRTYILQSSSNLGVPGSWVDEAESVVGNDALTPLVDPVATNQAKFYRIKDITP